jgi:CRP/FNR family cyclic AMP-dependent transcriptional regulator
VKWALLDVLPADEARALLSAARRRRFDRGETIFHEGDPGDTVHLLDKGRVAIRVTTPLGDTATIRVLGPGEIFGELAVISPWPRTATVRALEPVETLVMASDRIEQLRRAHPDVDRVMLEGLIGEVRRLTHQLLDALYLPVPKRLARCLVDLSQQYGSGVGSVLVPLNQDDVADLCGASRPTVNTILQELEGQGLIELGRGRISIVDCSALGRLAR